jgi:cell division protease FtsH
MSMEKWLPKGFTLPDQSSINKLLWSDTDWQIYDSDGSSNWLVVTGQLLEKWNALELLSDSIFQEISCDSGLFRALACNKKNLLYPVAQCDEYENKVDAIAFSIALRESRQIVKDASFHDAIYVEQYSRLLPTWSLTEKRDDAHVLGTWLAGGVNISTDSFRRLSKLVGWLPKKDLAEVISKAGLPVSSGAGVLVKSDPEDKQGLDIHEVSKKKTDRQSETQNSERKGFSLPGRPCLEAFFLEHIIDIIEKPDVYRKMGINFPSAVVLHGPPGCGKTFAVERLVEYLDWPNYSIDSNSVGSPYIHQTSKLISETFDTAIENAPSVLVIDEMESFLTDRQTSSLSGQHRVEEVAEFLRRIPEAISKNVLIVAMTNMIDVIDPAILRRGRFDHIIEVGMPSQEEVTSLLDSLLNNLPVLDSVDLPPLVDALTGRALSDAAFVVRESARLAARQGKSIIDQECLNIALKGLPGKDGQKTNPIGFI